MSPRPVVTDAPQWRYYDHTRYAGWPEYRAISEALDDFAHRLTGEGIELKQVAFESLLVDLARNLAAASSCPDPDCEDGRPRPPYLAACPTRDPYVGLVGSYRCAHGHRDQSWWGKRDAIVALMP